MTRQKIWLRIPAPFRSGLKTLLRPLLNPLDHYYELKLSQQLLTQFVSEQGFTRVGEYAAGDIFLTAFQKSGMTWLQSMAVAALYGLDLEKTPYALIGDLAPDLLDRQVYRRYGTPMLFKSHDMPRPAYRRVVLIVRDGRDVMTSFAHFQHARRQKRGITGRSYWQDIERYDQLEPRFRWADHVEAWLANPYDADLLVIRYEDMLADTARELRRFCDFAGVTLDDERLQTIVRQASFDRMRAREARYGMAHIQHWPDDQTFMRRGRSGSYQDEMPPDILAQFTQRAGETLHKLGYLDAQPDTRHAQPEDIKP